MASLTKIFRLILTLTAGLWILTATDGALAKGGSGSGKQDSMSYNNSSRQSSMSYNSSSRKSDHKDNDTDKHKDKYADKDKHKCKDSTCKDKDAGNTTGTGGITGKPPVATNPPGTPPPAAAPPGGDTVVRDHRPGGNAYDGPVELRDHRKPPIVRDHRSGGGGGTVTKPAPMPVAGAGY